MAAKRKDQQQATKRPAKSPAAAEQTTPTQKPKMPWYKELWANQAQLSFLLGAVVVIIVALFLLQRIDQPTKLETIAQTPMPTVSVTPLPTGAVIQTTTPRSISPSPSPSGTITQQAAKTEAKTYTVAVGDTLWSIAEKTYGTGYAWSDIAKANKLTNPNAITADTKLALPEFYVEKYPQTHSVGQATTQPSTYIVKSGDSLWNISLEVYGTGFNWPKIAQANNLSNPHIIHPGNTLTIPKLQ